MGAEQKADEKETQVISPFNSSIEAGVRSLVLLEASFPIALPIERLVEFDYLVVHTGDANGPASLHASVPLRTGALLIRRQLVESGIILMMSRDLIVRNIGPAGIQYHASETARPFLSALSSEYIKKLVIRAKWLIERYGSSTDEELRKLTANLLNQWTLQFQPIESPIGGNR